MLFSKTLSAIALAALAIASVSAAPQQARASPQKTVWITSANDHCLILPKTRENVGDSERPGGTRSFCRKPYDSAQGKLSGSFWKKAHFKKTSNYVQLTGCINPSAQSTLKSNDDGGQYDSSGGDGGRGNPRNSVCLGYKHYVEILEPAAKRACIRCCNNARDCDVSQDTAGCSQVIHGDYSC